MKNLGRGLVQLAVLVAMLAAGPRAAGAADRKVYFFGNSLIHHLSDSDETTVPHWLALMARAGGHGFAADGQWGFLRDFARPGKPLANWSFREVKGAWNRDRTPFAEAGFDAIIVNTANFIQYQAPDRPYDGDNPDGASPLSAMLGLIEQHGHDTPLLVYEGWAEMAGVADRFPPARDGLAKYHGYNRGAYHRWYEDFVAQLQEARPRHDIRLVPVARVLSELMSAEPLAQLPAEVFYLDDAPHGTPTTYLLAAAVLYQALYGEPAPTGLSLPETIHAAVREDWPGTVARISGALGVQEKAAAGAAPATQPVVAAAAAQGGAAVGLDNPSLAMGLNGIADWSTQHPFIDVMKTARPWVGHEGADWGAWDAARLAEGGYLDESGWPKALPPGVDRIEAFILTDQPEAATGLAGRYRVRWEGEGGLKITGRLRRVQMDEAAREAWFSYTPGEGLVALAITATEAGNPIRNIEVVHEDHVALHELGVTFNPDWIARIADLRGIRFMDWMLTNGSPVTGWDNRPTRGDFSYGWRGVPLEVMVDLANRIGADPWFCMPHLAGDDFAGQFAGYVRDHLDPRLKVYVEYSNELWNYTFPQARWAGEQARLRWGVQAGDDAWMQFAGMRAAQVMRAWGGVFAGPDAARLVRVMGVHTGWMGLEEPFMEAPLWVAEDGQVNLRPAAHFDAYAVSGYFGFELGDGEEGRLEDTRRWIAESVEIAEAAARQEGLQRKALEAAIAPVRFERAIPRAAQAVREGSLSELTETLWPYHRAVAARNGLELTMYEGGTHAVGHGRASGDAELTAFFNAFNYSPEMAALYGELLDAWRDVGGQMFNAFVDVAPPSQFGSWGALRHLQDDNPRWDVLMAVNARGPKGRARDPGAFLHGVLRQGEGEIEGTAEEDILLAGPGDDRLVSHGGGDALHGGDGVDIAVLPGRRDDYRFAMQGARLLAIRGPEVHALRAIEKLEFEGEDGRVYWLDLPD
ncbi:calcium-binding protein [Marimonas lutisalis]|uniref:calcium-binding protein n=1 Tax=Marimonas lutisalis TaxID=2545756 RepID=UPI001F39F227|nr:calcium-binding protein [Marimonas lutisalis]